jgi:hypothetical protein
MLEPGGKWQPIMVTRGEISCDNPDHADFEKFPETGHQCEWSFYGTKPRCQDEATVALSFDDGHPVTPLFCEQHAAEEERYAEHGYPEIPKGE